MTTSLVLGVVGAVIGSFIPVIGTQIGFAIGAAIGGYIDTVNTKINNTGPRLSDKQIQISSAGASIPILFGKMRFAGNIAWSTDLIETENKQSDGGKGEPQVNNTTFSYAISCYAQFCEGETEFGPPISGVSMLWFDNNLAYSVGPYANAATIIASARIAQSIRVTTGSLTQMPSALIESYVGVGNCPGYRGRAGIEFENLQLADYGNRLPQITAEIIRGGTFAVAHQNIGQITDADPGLASFRGESWITDREIYAWRRTNGSISAPLALFRSVDGGPFSYFQEVGVSPAIGSNRTVPCNTRDVLYMAYAWTRNDPVIDGGVTHQMLQVFSPALAPTTEGYGNRLLNLGIATSANTFDYDNLIVTYDQDSDATAIATRSDIALTFAARIRIFVGGSPIFGGIPPAVIGYDDVIRGTYLFRTSNEQCCGLASRNGRVYALINDGTNYRLLVLSQEDATLIASYVGPPSGGFETGDTTESIRTDGSSVWAWTNLGGGRVWKWLADGTFTILATNIAVRNYANADTTTVGGNMMYIGDEFIISQGQLAWNADTTHPAFVHQLVHYRALTSSDVTLASIITDLCGRRGVMDIDVSGITDMVHGYLVTKQMSARAAIEFLLSVYRIDAVESGTTLRFVKRGGAPVRTLTLDDIGAHEYGSDSIEPLQIQRKQESDLPKLLTVNFSDINNAYQQGSVPRLRDNTTSEQTITLDVTALALSGDEAAKIADVALAEAWVGRTTFRFTTTYRHADLQPTDVVLVDTVEAIYRMRIQRRTDKGGMLEWEAIADDAFAVGSVATGGGTIANPAIAPTARTDLVLMDIPILRDEDDDTGFYARLAPTGDNWRGANLFRSDQGNVTLEGTVRQANPVGVTLNALPPYVGIDSFDEASTVDVSVFGGLTLQSVTSAQVLGGMNWCLIGDEILGARTATMLASGVYRLSGLLRYRRDTSGVVHATSERFVALDAAGTLRVDHGMIDIGVARDYIGVSLGRPVDTGDRETLKNTARGKKPFRPVRLGAGITGTTDVVLSWVRQTRLASGLRSGAGARLDELLEAYTIEIANDAAFTDVRRRFSGVGAPPFVYSRTNRYADELGGLLSPFYWRVAQESAVVGLGTYSASASLVAAPATLPPVVVPSGPGAWNPDDFGRADAVITFSDGNNTASFLNGPHNFTALRSIDSISFGRKYFEFLVLGVPGTTANMLLGIVTRSTVLIGDQIGSPSGLGLYYRPNGQVFTVSGTSVGFVGSGPTFSAGDVIAFAVDDNTGAAWILRNNVSLGGSPSAGTSPLFAFTPGTELLPLMAQHSEVGASSTLRLSAASQSYAAPTGFSPVR